MNRILTFRGAVLVASLLLLAHAARADEVAMRNGDRVTGTVVNLAGGVLRFDTGRGALSLPWGDVVALTIEAPIVVTASGRPRETTGMLWLTGGRVLLESGMALEVRDIVALARPAGPPALNGTANAGFISTGGNTDVFSLHVDTEATVRADRNRYTFGGVVNRAVDGNVETARNATVSARYDRFVNPRFYGNGNAILTHDKFRDLDLRTAIGVGLGYQVADNARTKFNVEGGYGYVNERVESSVDNSYQALRENAALEIYVNGRRLTFFHRHDGFFGITGTENLFVQTKNGVRIGLIGSLVATLQYDLDYDRTPSPGRRQTDRSSGVTFGYRF